MGELRWFRVVRGPGVKVGDRVHAIGDVFRERPEDRYRALLDAGRIRVTEAPTAEAIAESVEATSVTEAMTGETAPRRVPKRGRGKFG